MFMVESGATYWHMVDLLWIVISAVRAVILLGIIKGRMIIRYFMEVRTAPRWLKLFTAGWLTVLWAGILAIYSYQGELN